MKKRIIVLSNGPIHINPTHSERDLVRYMDKDIVGIIDPSNAGKTTQEVLNRSISFLRYELRDKLKVRYLPELRFFYDNTFDYSQKISNLMSKINDEDNK